MTIERRDIQALRANEPKQIKRSFLKGVTKATTSYSEGWREVCARLLWAEEMLDALSRVEAPQEDDADDVAYGVCAALDEFQTRYEKNTWSQMPGNDLYSSQLMGIVVAARAALEVRDARLTPRDPAPSERKDEAND